MEILYNNVQRGPFTDGKILGVKIFFLHLLVNLETFFIVWTRQKIPYNNVQRRPFTYGSYLGSYDVQKIL